MASDDDDDIDYASAKESIGDVLLNKLISRKLVVFVAGTIFFAMGKVTETEWMMLASLYVGMQGSIDALSAYLAKKQSQ